MSRYWVGGTGNWSDTSHWSTSSGGAGGAAVPTSSDDVFFDANSFSSDGQIVTLNQDATTKSLDCSAITHTAAFESDGSYRIFNIYGSATLSSSLTIGRSTNTTYSPGELHFKGAASHTITWANAAFISGRAIDIYFDGGGTYTLQDTFGLTAHPPNGIYLTSGTLDTNGQTITNTSLYAIAGTLTLGASSWNGYAWQITGSATLNAGTSTITLANGTGFQFDGGNHTYNNVVFKNSYFAYVHGNNTFANLTLQQTATNNVTIDFDAGTTQTITGNFTVTKSGTKNIVIYSSGSQFTLSKSSGTVTVTGLSYQDSNVTGGATWNALDSSNQDLGNNTGWAALRTVTGSSSGSATSSATQPVDARTLTPTAAGGTATSQLAASVLQRVEANASRKIVQSTQIAWKKDFVSTYIQFTIGSSTIGGGDYIASDGSINSDWNKYAYSDESSYVTQLNYEQELNMPLGGLVKGIGDVQLDNTSRRFLPDYMGGDSELFTVVSQPRKPLIINTGYNYGGIDNMNPQFVGITVKAPLIDRRNATVDLNFADFVDFIQNKYVDETAMYTGVRSDTLIQTILTDLGYSTAQYELDTGINIIPFAYLPAGSKLGDIINDIAQAENAHIYQDVNGVIRFENRQHWNTPPYTNVQRVITTAMVLDAQSPSDDHIINVVEVNSTPYTKQASAQIYSAPLPLEINATGNTDIFINFDNPVLQASDPVYTINTKEDGTGTDLTASVSLQSSYVFAQAAKYRFNNTSGQTCYITSLTVNGREASPTATPIYYRTQDDSSVTAYEERPITIENNYIQSISWAQSYAALILNDFSDPENLQTITIRGISGLKISDLISWQGKHWRIYGVRTTMNPSVGYVQELDLLQREIVTYFRIGVSLIAGSDGIAP